MSSDPAHGVSRAEENGGVLSSPRARVSGSWVKGERLTCRVVLGSRLLELCYHVAGLTREEQHRLARGVASTVGMAAATMWRSAVGVSAGMSGQQGRPNPP
jgi:hypothetical protein